MQHHQKLYKDKHIHTNETMSSDDINDKLVKTGTTTVGIICKDAIILAADMRESLGGRIISGRKTEKIQIINDNLAVTTAGLVSDIQLLLRIVRAQLNLEAMKRNGDLSVKEAVHLLANLVYNNSRRMSMIPGITGFLLGGRDKSGLYLYDVGMDGSVTDRDEYAADGSGMMFALGVLESEYTEGLSVNEGMKLAVKAVSAAMRRDTASGDGINVVAITKDGIKKILSKRLTERITV